MSQATEQTAPPRPDVARAVLGPRPGAGVVDGAVDAVGGGADPAGAVRDLVELLAAYATDPSAGRGAAGARLIDLVTGLEELRSAAAAALARASVAFDVWQREQHREQGLSTRRVGVGVGEHLALARGVSPAQGIRDLGRSKTLCTLMPHTLAALAAGVVTELKAHRIVDITNVLAEEDRILADLELAGGPEARAGLRGMATNAVEAQARRVAYRLDPHAYLKAKERAVSERRVTIRPAPDGMEYLSALVPMKAGIACYKSLKEHAERMLARGEGGGRTLAQLQADTLIERLTGQTTADIAVEVTLVITPDTLTGGDDPAETDDGPIPAGEARSWLAEWLDGLDDDAAVTVRRAATDPVTGDLTHLESSTRWFTPTMRRAITLRDRFCSTPGCGAPLRHLDHATPVAQGGATTVRNGRGTCARCNLVKEAPGWRVRVLDGADSLTGGRMVEITTPTGHVYSSQPPPLPGAPPRWGRVRPPDRPLTE